MPGRGLPSVTRNNRQRVTSRSNASAKRGAAKRTKIRRGQQPRGIVSPTIVHVLANGEVTGLVGLQPGQLVRIAQDEWTTGVLQSRIAMAVARHKLWFSWG